MNSEDLAYTAGIVDGEGSISLLLENTTGRYRGIVKICNTNEWLIRWLHTNFNGSIQFSTHALKKDIWVWSASCTTALHFLEQVQPYLRIKKPQAEIVIAYLRSRRGKQKCSLTDEQRAVIEAQRITMKVLNKRGK